MKDIRSRVIKTEPIIWQDLQFIQQENFKEWLPNGDTKLQQSLLKYQFIDPFKVWEHEGILYCLIADSILDTTNRGDIVIDWFLGSGTCLIACEQTNRLGRFTEIEPMYVQSAIQRYFNFCNRKGIDIKFTHLNGNLKLIDFQHEPKLSNIN